MGFRSTLVVLSAAAALSVAAAPVSAQYAQMAELREQVDARRWARAIELAETYLTRSDLTASLRNATMELLALAQQQSGDAAAAEDLLTALHARDPRHQPAEASPPAEFREMLARVRQGTRDPVHVDLLHSPPSTLQAGAAPSLSARLGGASNAVAHVWIFHRGAGGTDFVRREMELSEGGASATLPSQSGEAGASTQYYFEARAPSGFVLARLGTAVQPLSLTIPASGGGGGGGGGTGGTGADTPILDPSEGEDDEPDDASGGGILSQWWFWTAVGVVLVGGGVAGWFLFGPGGGENAPDGSLGNVELLRFP